MRRSFIFITDQQNPLVDPTAALYRMAVSLQGSLTDAERAIDALDSELAVAASLIREMRERMLITGCINAPLMAEVDAFLGQLVTRDKYSDEA